MILLLSGMIIGFIMGLTGSGGALVAIPLFIHGGELSLREASTLSLVAVIAASFANLFFMRKLVDLKTSSLLVVSALPGSWLAVPWKERLSESTLLGLILLIALVALFSVWRSPAPEREGARRHSFFFLPAGLILGILTTLTGLGGGVLLLPFLLLFAGLEMSRAVASSMLVVGVTSLVSLGLQASVLRAGPREISFLLAGILSSAFFMRLLTRNLDPILLGRLRQWAFSGVVGLVILGLLLS